MAAITLRLQTLLGASPRSLHNLIHLFAPNVSQTRCFMNNGAAPELVFHQQSGAQRSVVNAAFFDLLSLQAQP
jgi:hypothetical protein